MNEQTLSGEASGKVREVRRHGRWGLTAPVGHMESFRLGGRALEHKDWVFFHRPGPLLPGSPLKAQEEAGAGRVLGYRRNKIRPLLGT